MAPAFVKRSPFDVLSLDDTGDGCWSLPPAKELVVEKRRRRRRKNKLSPGSGSSADLVIADLMGQGIGPEVPNISVENGMLHQKEEQEKDFTVPVLDAEMPGDLVENTIHANGNSSPPARGCLHDGGEKALDYEERTNGGEMTDAAMQRCQESSILHANGGEVTNVAVQPCQDSTILHANGKEAVEVSYQGSIILHALVNGSSLEETIRAGYKGSRDRVYNALWHVPWRCELLILAGFLACVDSFLSLLVATPVRVATALWKCLRRGRMLGAGDWSDLANAVILVIGVLALQQTDMSYIYHSIRFEPNIKLYVIYNMLEVADKLCQSFGVDVLQLLFHSGRDSGTLWAIRDWIIGVFCFVLHSCVIFVEAIALSAALHSTESNTSLLILLVSNNFAEIKSTVFKRYNQENLHDLAHADTVERFHLLTCLFFAFAQNIIPAEGPWMHLFFYHAAMVMICETVVDLVKHSYLAKVNQVKPEAYTEFLERLCEQIISGRKDRSTSKPLKFVPLGPACVVIKVLLPLYASYISTNSAWSSLQRLITLGGGTIAILVALKLVVRICLHQFAARYLKSRHVD